MTEPASARSFLLGEVEALEALGFLVAQELLVENFGEKPDAPLDIAHGSRRLEHEARRKLTVARGRIEKIVTERASPSVRSRRPRTSGTTA